MKTLTLCFVLVTLFELVNWGLALSVPVIPCSNPDGDVTLNCTVHEVDLQPCKKMPRGKPCRVRRGRDATLRFDFTPNFLADNLTARAYAVLDGIDTAFPAMNTNACESTTCPVTSGTRQTYTYALPLNKNYPDREYEVKWKLWNHENQGCCFRFHVNLAR